MTSFVFAVLAAINAAMWNACHSSWSFAGLVFTSLLCLADAIHSAKKT
jgi:hypothetical protein